MAYAFKAIFSNEMKGLVFPCKGSGAIPFGPTYTDFGMELNLYHSIYEKGKKKNERK